MSDNLLINYQVKLEIDTTPFGASRTWVELGAGFDNIDEDLADKVLTMSFLSDKGYTHSFVVGQDPSFKLSGVRVKGDTAQDYIFDYAHKYGLAAERNTNFRLTVGNGDGTVRQVETAAVFTNLKEIGGGAQEGAKCECTLKFQGKPTVTAVVPASTVSVTSVAGATAGTTIITVTPTFPDAGCKYVYKTGATAPAATVGEVIVGWNDLSNGGTYSMTAGEYITVAMVDTTTMKCVKSANTTIVTAT